MKIGVTGGNGGMGRHLIPYLLEQGHDVVSLDLRLPDSPWERRSRHLIADVTDMGQLTAGLAGCDALVHLAAHTSPNHHPETVVYHDNTLSSYYALSAAAVLGIKRVCQASSINAIGGVYSRQPKYDFFPVDETHPTYAEDAYSLSKWVMEQQGDAFARRYEWMTIGSLRFHWLLDSRERALQMTRVENPYAVKHMWAYTLFSAAARAILLTLTADYSGHEAFYIVAPRTAVEEESMALIERYYPDIEIRKDMSGQAGFFDCSKAERLLGWRHED
ncbi:MAG: NAD(P)-dependent oxidoreductase [Anaerolineales bacterium]|nr:NAD(P)-dependent oxidoreductase [Anaerolineales bacterium]MCB0007228.1 NAD(P)-dependent oxidoreductase [Anaerolineales bacterium]MCB0010497.1 NAD(P)-dependent oxidoreductase [Anaerolineales bacterium]MCB0016657.1 NAD(P)-dependent oxidoreductase [Anaerolineales bacterium]MCB0027466.1 NAD(P)-dependent oxidoreductase [Anaerolineales bacterium]